MNTQITSQQTDRIAQQVHAARLETKPKVSAELLSEPWEKMSTAGKDYERVAVTTFLTVLEANGYEVRQIETGQGAGRSA